MTAGSQAAAANLPEAPPGHTNTVSQEIKGPGNGRARQRSRLLRSGAVAPDWLVQQCAQIP